MTPDSTVSRVVMRRVRAIHATRLFAAPAASALALVIALWGIKREVWVAKVFENMPALTDVPAVLSFYASAFLGTGLSVQLLCILLAASALWLASEFAHLLRSGLRPA